MFEKLFGSRSPLLLFLLPKPSFTVVARLHFPDCHPSFVFLVLPAVRPCPCCIWPATLVAARVRPRLCFLKRVPSTLSASKRAMPGMQGGQRTLGRRPGVPRRQPRPHWISWIHHNSKPLPLKGQYMSPTQAPFFRGSHKTIEATRKTQTT